MKIKSKQFPHNCSPTQHSGSGTMIARSMFAGQVALVLYWAAGVWISGEQPEPYMVRR
jgi:hypothetical protein